ncbi:MAG TPA: substrate-binding domain-containing protein [Psychromonas sp.]
MATIKDVARLANVSVATVSRVTNNSPKASKASIKAVHAAMHTLGYRPNANARALASQTTNTVGVVVGDVSDPFFGALVKSVDQEAAAQGKHLLIGNGYHDANCERKAIELLINSRCDALIVHSKALADDELIALAKELPGLVFINRYIEEIANRCICLDNARGAYLITEHLIKQGHRHIGYICSNHDIEDAHQRKAGFLAALKDHGIDCPEEYIEYASPDEAGGEQAMSNLLAKGLLLSAVSSYNDSMAAGALSIMDENAIEVPNQISLTGFDDVLIAKYLRPKLTTMRYPIEMMATQATQLALSLAKKQQNKAIIHSFSPTLIRRHSVASLRVAKHVT